MEIPQLKESRSSQDIRPNTVPKALRTFLAVVFAPPSAVNPVPAFVIFAILGAPVIALFLGPCVVDLARRLGFGQVANLTFMPISWLRMMGAGWHCAVALCASRRLNRCPRVTQEVFALSGVSGGDVHMVRCRHIGAAFRRVEGRWVAVTMRAKRLLTLPLGQIPILVQFRVQAVVIGGIGFVEDLHWLPMGADSLGACCEFLVYCRSGFGALVKTFELGSCDSSIGLLRTRRLTYRYDH